MKRQQLTSKGIHGIFCRFESRIHKGRQHQKPVTWKHLLNLTQWQTIGLAIILLLVPAFAFGGESTMKVYSTLPGAPEGLCLDSKGNLYASMPALDEVVLLNRDGTRTRGMGPI